MQMYDHLYQRGYVREIPGAPMCACIEQMAVVTRADCTQLDVDETWEFNIDTSGKLDAHIIKVDIDFNACQVSQCLRKPFNGFVPNTSIIRRLTAILKTHYLHYRQRELGRTLNIQLLRKTWKTFFAPPLAVDNCAARCAARCAACCSGLA